MFSARAGCADARAATAATDSRVVNLIIEWLLPASVVMSATLLGFHSVYNAHDREIDEGRTSLFNALGQMPASSAGTCSAKSPTHGGQVIRRDRCHHGISSRPRA